MSTLNQVMPEPIEDLDEALADLSTDQWRALKRELYSANKRIAELEKQLKLRSEQFQPLWDTDVKPTL